ncbi:MAG: hypothetical protein HDQ96_14195 [Lachnospiraceae bacterium]|nr:hypothetical protein [Lachnospiraceae bacterium]
MKKSVLKGIFFGIVLFAALFLFETVMNLGNTDMTADMAPASYPLVYMNVSGEQVNCLHGYKNEMEPAYMRDTITPLDNGRNLGITVEKFGTGISEISYQIRSCDGSRLIEETEITEYDESENFLTAYFTVKDLLEQGKEYNFIVNLRLDSGRDVHYYTRILLGQDYHVWEKTEFVKKFHEDTFDKENVEENLSMYLESNKQGDNSSFARVDIHSSWNQVTWGDLAVEKVSEAIVDIKEMMPQTASFQVHYQVEIPYEGKRERYVVNEYYRIRYTTDRIYLLDFEREMNQLFDEKKSVYSNNKISLGIQGADQVELMECDGGNIFAFVAGNRLFSYNVIDNKLALLFSFQNEDNLDRRTIYDKHTIRILNVDEAGNVQFVVYGYMNRGRLEGETGVQVNLYNSSQNTIEELVFIPYTKSPELLEQDISRLSFAGNNGRFYMMVDSTVYEMNLSSRQCRAIAENLDGDCFRVSGNGKMFAWIEGNRHEAQSMQFMNLMSGKRMTIEAGYGEYVQPLGFMGDDLIYGIANRRDVARDNAGRIFFPMHTVRIQDEKESVLKEYTVPDTYVMSCDVQENQIVLHRVKKGIEEATGELVYVEESDDQIMYSKKEDTGKNLVETIVVDRIETLTQIAVKSNIDTDTLQLLTPREVLFEGENKISLPDKQEEIKRFFVYTIHGLTGAYTEEAAAVSAAYEAAGVVTDITGNYVWYRGNRVTRNQIMKITGGETEDEATSGLAVCLNTILEFEGVNRSTQYMLDSGMSTVEILQENIPDIQVLDLTGCALDAILYYTNQDIPVLTTLEDGGALLITGFNELNIVVMDPKDGTVYKVGMNDATAMLQENGNRFITYMRTGK